MHSTSYEEGLRILASVSRRAARLGLALMVFLILVTTGLGFGTARANVEDLFSGVKTIVAPYSSQSGVSVDGKISTGEYYSNVTYTLPETGVSISLMHDNNSLFVGIQGPAWSWVAFGVSSDEANTMGFVVVTRSDYDFTVQERLVTTVDESMVFTSPPAGSPAVEKFQASLSGDNSAAEIQLALVSSMWSLAPGVVYPAVVASNLTAPAGTPAEVSGNDAHFVGTYMLRADDNVRLVNELLNGKISPVPSVVALAIIVLGVAAIFTEFVVRKRRDR